MLEILVKKKNPGNIGHDEAVWWKLDALQAQLRINQVGPQTSRAGGKVGHFK